MSFSSAHAKREELREKISQNHLAYLAHEENPCKIEKRKALEGLIAEYLAIVPNREKFIIERVGDVLSHSVFNNQDFSAYEAATAFQSIEKYATNLLSQPWRKEYRNIKMYSGFYKHFIERPLPNAHQIFEAMGYTIQNLELEFEEPVDPDPVRHVALDCLVAYVECQIMLQVCESVRAFDCNWTEIHGVRQNYVCSIEEATRILQQMKIAQREEAKSTNKNLLPPLAQPEQIIVTPESNSSVWNDNSPYESLPSQNMLLNLDDDLLGKKNDWPAVAEPSSRRSKIQLDGLTISRSRRSPSWTEGLNSSPVFNFNLHDDEREGRKPGSKHNYLQYTWQSEGCDPFEVYGNFGSKMVPKNGAKTWNQPPPYIPPITPPNHPNRPPISGRFESWDLIDHPIIPNPTTVYLPVMMPTPVIRQPLIPAPPPFSSTNASNLVSPNPYFDYGHRNSKSLPRKMVEINAERDNQPNYVKKEKDPYVSDSVDIMGLEETVNKPKWKSTANVFRPPEPPLDDPTPKYTTNTLLSKFDDLRLADVKPKTSLTNRNQMSLKVGIPHETKTNENKQSPVLFNENGKTTHNREPDFNTFQSALGDITFQNDNSSAKMTKRNSFYDNVPMIDSDNGLPSGCLSLGGETSSLISQSIEKDNYQTAKNGYRNDATTSLDRNAYQKIISANRISNGERPASDGKESLDPLPVVVKIEQWSCAFCTYINTKSDHICEMCGRSKEAAVEISPLESGGKQCPKCTLVNDKDSSNCSACDMSLKDCATYI